jgi:hypothetical protein
VSLRNLLDEVAIPRADVQLCGRDCILYLVFFVFFVFFFDTLAVILLMLDHLQFRLQLQPSLIPKAVNMLHTKPINKRPCPLAQTLFPVFIINVVITTAFASASSKPTVLARLFTMSIDLLIVSTTLCTVARFERVQVHDLCRQPKRTQVDDNIRCGRRRRPVTSHRVWL